MKTGKILYVIVLGLFLLSVFGYLSLSLSNSILTHKYDFPEKTIEYETLGPEIKNQLTVLEKFNLEIVYKEKVWFGDDLTIVEFINPNNENYRQPFPSPLLIETRLEIGELVPNPGDTFLIPINKFSIIQRIWKIENIRKNEIEGKIYAFLVPINPEGRQGQSIPLLVIPIQLKIRSILGIPTQILRAIFVILACINILFITLVKKRINSE